jgi:tRNA pseudouridine38-40 synthase
VNTVLLGIAYDGAPWAGLVPQQNAATVGGELLRAIHTFDGDVCTLRVASRTDAGVHARDNRVAFDTHMDVAPRGWVLGLRQHLPSSVAVRWAARAAPGYNPRYETASKLYRYRVLCDPLDDPFHAGRAWRLFDLEPEAEALIAAELDAARGEHDFSAFASSRDRREHRVRMLTHVGVARDDRLLILDIEGNGFLHNMVRIIVGTAIDVARGKRPAGSMARALASGDRRHAGITAPPDGLYLERLRPRDEPLDRWPALPSRTP